MAPPKFSELLQRSNDVLLRGMHYGWWRFLVHSKTNNDMQFTTTGESNINREILGMFKVKKWFRDHNFVISQRWFSTKDMYTQVSLFNKPWEGLVLSLGENYNWDEEKFRTHFKGSYAADYVNFTFQSIIEDKKPPISAAIVLGHKNFLFGYQTVLDTDETKVNMNNFCLGYVDHKFAVHGFFNMGKPDPEMENFRQYACSLWHNATDYIDVGALIRKRTDEDDTDFEVGIKYKLDDDAYYRVKINNEMQLGVGLAQGLGKGLTLFLATRVNLDKFWDGGHKLGIGLEINV